MKVLILLLTIFTTTQASEIYRLTKTGVLKTNLKGSHDGAPCTVSYEFEEQNTDKKVRTLSGDIEISSEGEELAHVPFADFNISTSINNGVEFFNISPIRKDIMDMKIDDFKTPKKFIYSFLNEEGDKEEASVVNYECQFNKKKN